MDTKNPQDFDTALSTFVAYAQKLIDDDSVRSETLTVKRGRRYVKISEGSGVWGFIDIKNGDVLKAASWKAPAKHARGTIYTSDPAGYGIGAYGPNYL